jgi:hypothetical protein
MRPINRKFEFLQRITNVVDDWLTPVEYLPYIDALLGDIDLDPCSTARANKEFLRAKKIITYEEDGLNTDIPWTGKTYLFPPTYGRCSFSKPRGTWRWSLKGGKNAKTPAAAWFGRLEREWKLRNIPEALFYTTTHEIMRTCPQIWDYPMCIPSKRCELIHGKRFDQTIAFTWGFFVYLPKSEFGFRQVDDFTRIFSHLGKVLY